jgi:hypothetical protein
MLTNRPRGWSLPAIARGCILQEGDVLMNHSVGQGPVVGRRRVGPPTPTACGTRGSTLARGRMAQALRQPRTHARGGPPRRVARPPASRGLRQRMTGGGWVPQGTTTIVRRRVLDRCRSSATSRSALGPSRHVRECPFPDMRLIANPPRVEVLATRRGGFSERVLRGKREHAPEYGRIVLAAPLIVTDTPVKTLRQPFTDSLRLRLGQLIAGRTFPRD